jgi:SH3-like domain-containing protein
MVLYLLFWLMLCFRSFRPRRGLLVAAVLCIAFSSMAAASAGATWWCDRRTPAGVVLAMDVSVYKGPGTSYQRQFLQPLQPGVEFTLREQRGQWWEIELADGKTGWIEAGRADLVPTDRSGSLQLIEDS